MARVWEGTQPGQPTPTDQRDIPHHMTLWSALKLGEWGVFFKVSFAQRLAGLRFPAVSDYFSTY